MKTKLLVFFCLTIICAFLGSCTFSITEEQEDIPINDMNTSRTGILSCGKTFIFYGADQVSITLEQYLEEMGFIYLCSWDFIVKEETIEEMLENPELDLGVGHLNSDDVTIVVYYFSESNDVLFTVEPNDDRVTRLGGINVTVVNYESGHVSMYYDGFV
jgi:hypothetical protein